MPKTGIVDPWEPVQVQKPYLNREGNGTARDSLLQGLQKPDPVIEQAIETAALMLGSDKSRGYCLEMICADFLAGANLDNESPEILLQSITQFFKFLPGDQKQRFLNTANEKIA